MILENTTIGLAKNKKIKGKLLRINLLIDLINFFKGLYNSTIIDYWIVSEYEFKKITNIADRNKNKKKDKKIKRRKCERSKKMLLLGSEENA